MNNLVTTEWLEKNINKKNLIILDASLDKTASGVKSNTVGHYIPRTRFFDLKNYFSSVSVGKSPSSSLSLRVASR